MNMNMQHFENFESSHQPRPEKVFIDNTLDIKEHIVDDTNRMQIEIALMAGYSDVNFAEWIEKNSKDFRDILEAEPNLIEQYDTHPEETVAYLYSRLHGDTSMKQVS
jgi:hypothetical protein